MVVHVVCLCVTLQWTWQLSRLHPVPHTVTAAQRDQITVIQEEGTSKEKDWMDGWTF